MRQLKVICIFCVIMILVASCTQSSGAGNNSSAGETASSAGSPAASGNESSAGSRVAFYQPQSGDEVSPKFHLWVEPVDEDPMPPILVECMGEESELYSPKTGLLLNNHCIIKTRERMATVVLWDGSYLMINQNTIVQFNSADNVTEVILQEGEVYFDVAKQESGQSFKVTFGDSSLDVVGTEFDVNFKDKMMSVFMQEGSVAHYVCTLWENDICSEWGQVFENLFGTNLYNREIGKMEWETTEYTEDWVDTGEGPDLDFIMKAKLISDVYDQTAGSGLGVYQAAAVLMGNLTLSQSHFDIPDENYNQMANEKNEQTASLFCEYYPENCFAPTAQPTMSVPVVEQPSMSSGSGSSSGGAMAPSSFPTDFTPSKCSTQYGNYYCTSNEAGKAGTWNLTEICKVYPGENYCSWPEVQNTLR